MGRFVMPGLPLPPGHEFTVENTHITRQGAECSSRVSSTLLMRWLIA